MKYLIFLLLAANATAQTCNNAVVTQSGSSMNIALSGCGVPGVVMPPVVVAPVVTPLVVAPPVVIAPPTDNLPNPSKSAFVPGPSHGGLNGAGPEINAYAMDATRCVTSPPLTRSWQHNIDLMNYKNQNAFDFFAMNGGEALSYKFTVPTNDMSGGFIYNDGANAVVRPTLISVTTSPCDFDRTQVGKANSCYVTGLNGNSLNWANITGPLPASYCRLVKGQTYYVNLRFQDARPGMPATDACINGNCGGILQVL